MMASSSSEVWLLLDSGTCDYAFNMALDETLLEFVSELNRPVLRFYGWNQPAASFGYFQKISEIEHATQLRPLVRRPTGGGLVPHDADWTYSFVVPPSHAWYDLRASESYEQMHRWIQEGFTALDVTTELAPCCRKEIPGQCFAGYEKSDLLWLGRKIAGAAQRRNKMGLLVQGSVQPQPNGISRTQWQDAMRSASRNKFQTLDLPENILSHANELAATKYSREEYNRRR